MSMSEATGAPAPVRIAGKEYSASPIGFDGLGELEEYARARILAIAAKAGEDLPPALGDRLLDRALAKATGVSFDGEEVTKYLRSDRGMITLLSISLRPHHPGMTRDAIAKLLKGRATEAVTAVDAVLRISGFGGDGKDGQKPGEGEAGETAAA
jgi:hypothetical protein